MPLPFFSRRQTRAFSLIESLVVLATVGILVFVLVPAFKIYVLGHSPIGDDTVPPQLEELRKRGTYDIRFAPESARKAAENPPEETPDAPREPTGDSSEKMPESPQ